MGINLFSLLWRSAALLVGLLGGAAWAATPAALYHDHCSVCHGDRGDGNSRARASLNPPPRDFTTADLSRQTMIAGVTHGRPGTAMVGWSTRLSAQEIEAVVDYIRATLMRPQTPARPGDPRAIYPNGRSGDPPSEQQLADVAPEEP